jgi:hypothetical protein
VGSLGENGRLRLQYLRNSSSTHREKRFRICRMSYFRILEAQLLSPIYRDNIYERQSLPDAMYVGYINLRAKNCASKIRCKNARVQEEMGQRHGTEGLNKIPTLRGKYSRKGT